MIDQGKYKVKVYGGGREGRRSGLPFDDKIKRKREGRGISPYFLGINARSWGVSQPMG